MPPFVRSNSPKWTSSNELERFPHRSLKPNEVDQFLQFLFSDVARRPGEMRLREAVQVAKYLRSLAWELPPGPGRALLDDLSKVIRDTAFQVAPIKSTKKPSVTGFLRRHAGTYLRRPIAERAIALVDESDIPKPSEKEGNPPELISQRMSIRGDSVAHLRDDLGERISVGYWAIREAKVHGARGLVAKALNAQGHRQRSRQGGVQAWDSYAVYERVKQVETRSTKRQGFTKKQHQRWRKAMVNKWLGLFHLAKDEERS